MSKRSLSLLCLFITISLCGAFIANLVNMLAEFVTYENLKINGVETTAEIVGYDKIISAESKPKFTYTLEFYDKYHSKQTVVCKFHTHTEFEVCDSVTIFYDSDNVTDLCIKGINTGKGFLAPTIALFIAAAGMLAVTASLKKSKETADC